MENRVYYRMPSVSSERTSYEHKKWDLQLTKTPVHFKLAHLWVSQYALLRLYPTPLRHPRSAQLFSRRVRSVTHAPSQTHSLPSLPPKRPKRKNRRPSFQSRDQNDVSVVSESIHLFASSAPRPFSGGILNSQGHSSTISSCMISVTSASAATMASASLPLTLPRPYPLPPRCFSR